MSNGPVPSHLCLLSNLSTKNTGDKVRFLGCITSYSTKTAVLTLQHQHPRESRTRALVDMSLLLEGLKSDQTQVGEWVNVIGYIRPDPAGRTAEPPNHILLDVHVQALVLWSAGPLNLDLYEASLANMVS